MSEALMLLVCCGYAGLAEEGLAIVTCSGVPLQATQRCAGGIVEALHHFQLVPQD